MAEETFKCENVEKNEGFMGDLGRNLLKHGADFVNDPSKMQSVIDDPSKLLNVGANFIGQEVLDQLIDKALSEAGEALSSSGLDPIPIPDMTIPYNLDKLTGACAPFLKNKNSPLAELALALCQCIAKNMNVQGDLFLKNGLLRGLSQLRRSLPTTFSVDRGSAKLGVGLGVDNLEAPFDASASIASDDFQPEVKAIVEKLGIKFDVEVPFTGETTTGDFSFEPALDDLPVDVDIKLGELQELADIVKPLVIAPIKEKIKEILKGRGKEIIMELVKKNIPGISSLT